MSHPKNVDIRGFEYDWIALDEDGHVGFFSTAGGGIAPSGFFDDVQIHDQAIESLMNTTATTSALFWPELSGVNDNPWREMASRGLYAFDSSYLGTPYRLVACPAKPKHYRELPPIAQMALKNVKLEGVRFRELELVPESATNFQIV